MTLYEVTQTFFGISSLILSFSALCVSIYIYKKISFKSDFKKKQLETVYKLIEELQDTIIFVSVHGSHKDSNITSGNMFRFFQLKLSKNECKEFNNSETLLVTRNPENIFEFMKFSEHPYMVSEIANIIRDFVKYDRELVELKDFNSFTLLGELVMFDREKTFYKILNNPVYKDFNSFCEKCKELDNAIHKWLKSVGIDNFNKKMIIE